MPNTNRRRQVSQHLHRHNRFNIRRPVLFTFALCLLSACKPLDAVLQDTITLDSNGYSDVLVAFDKDIPETKREALLTETQKLIQSTSRTLHTITSGRAFFNTVTLLVPKSWNLNAKRHVAISKTRSLYAKDAHVVVHREDKVFNNEPIVVQFAGCGKPALRVDVSQTFLEQISRDESLRETRARILTAKWSQYRYGVFDERGFIDDSMYPTHYAVPGSDLIKITSCAASASGDVVQPETRNRNKRGDECSLSVSGQNGFPEVEKSDCVPSTDLSEKNGQIISSFLYEPRLSDANQLCDHRTHNAEAPTKHNLLCAGKSVWEVLEKHPDFKREFFLKANDVPDVKFKLLEMESPRVVVLVDQLFNRTEDIKNVVKKFTGDLPANSSVRIFEYQTSNETNEADNLVGHEFLADICLYCGLRKALDFTLKNREANEADSSTSEFIVITEGRIADNEQQLLNLAERLKQKGIKLKVIIFPHTKSEDYSRLEQFVANAKGELIAIREEIESRGLKTSTLAKLYDTFDAIRPSDEKKHLLLNRDTFTGSRVHFNFSLDQSIIDAMSSVYVYLFVPNIRQFSYVKRWMKLENQKEKVLIEPTKSSEDLLGTKDTRGFKLDSSILKTGQWTLSFDTTQSLGDETFVAVAVAIPRFVDQVIEAQCWIRKSEDESEPFALYAFVKRGHYEYVRDAIVWMIVTDENGNVVEREVMIDDGFGDPDITKGDGIYSQYIITTDHRGQYSANIIVSSRMDTNVITKEQTQQHCCGSSIVAQSSQLTPHLLRSVNCGSFFVDQNYERRKYFGAISSLQVVNVDQQTRQVDLAFKIPFGSISAYEFRFFRSDELPYIREQFSDRGFKVHVWNFSENGPVSPVKYGDVQHLIPTVPFKEAGLYYFAIKTSRAGLRPVSRVSNLVSFYMLADPTFTTEGNADTSSSMTIGFKTDNDSDSVNTARLQLWQIIAVVAGSLIVIVLTLLLIICAVFIAKRRRGDQRSKYPKISTPVLSSDSKANFAHKSNTFENNALDMSEGPGKRPLTDNELTLPELSATISPVNAWSAGRLLEHYDRVQEAKERKEPPPVMRIEDIPDNTSSVSNNSKFRESMSDEDNVHHVAWQQYDQQAAMHHAVPHYNQYYPPNEWRQSFNGHSDSPSEYEHRYGIAERKGSSAVSQV